MNLLLNLTDELNVAIFQIGIDRIRQTADQQILPEVVHHLIVGRLVQGFQSFKLLPHGRHGKLVQPVGIEEFLEVQREHPNFTDTAHGDRCSLRQSHPQQGAAGNISESIILGQKLQQRQQMRICLDLVDKNQCVVFLLHLAAFQHTDL